jgi:NTP pyrophosphatase (non-canonical NTP hydrolase)
MEEIEHFKTYAKWTVTTSIHKTPVHAKTATILGIAGEVYEFLEKLYSGEATDEEMFMELGDIFYYIGHAFYRFGWINKIKAIKGIMDDFVYSLESDGIHHAMLLLEHYKKIVRDADYNADEYTKKEDVVEILNILLTLSFKQCIIMNVDFKEILEKNQQKLVSRLERGVIGGHGDER